MRYLRCIATAAEPQEGPSRLVLTVRQAWRCLPWLSTKRTIATFTFPGGAWRRGSSGEWENVAVREISSGRLSMLRRMDPDLPVRVKAWLHWGCSKGFLKSRLGDLLRELEEPSPPSAAAVISAPVGVTSTSVRLWVSMAAPEPQGVVLSQGLGGLDVGSEQPPAAAGGEVRIHSPAVASDGEGRFTEKWVTFVNRSTGSSVRLPAHTKEEAEGRWSGPGAWTAEDDALDDQALKIIDGISCRPFKAAQERSDIRRSRKQQQWRPVAFILPDDKQSPAMPQLDSAVPADHLLPAFSSRSAPTRDLEGRKVTLISGRSSKLPPPPRQTNGRVETPLRNRPQGPSRLVLLTFGLVILMVLLTRGDGPLFVIA